MKKALQLSLLLLYLSPIVLSAQAADDAPTTEAATVQPVKQDAPEQLQFTGTITYVDVEGGFYGITAADGRRFVALNLPFMLKEANTPVAVEAVPAEGVIGIHMWGSYIKLHSISVLPPCDE